MANWCGSVLLCLRRGIRACLYGFGALLIWNGHFAAAAAACVLLARALPSLTLMKTSYLTNSTSVGWKQNHVDLHWYPRIISVALRERRAPPPQYFKSNSHFSQDALLFPPPRARLRLPRRQSAMDHFAAAAAAPNFSYRYVLKPKLSNQVVRNENYASNTGKFWSILDTPNFGF